MNREVWVGTKTSLEFSFFFNILLLVPYKGTEQGDLQYGTISVFLVRQTLKSTTNSEVVIY